MTASRPLRALWLTVGGYVAVRASVLWLAVEPPRIVAESPSVPPRPLTETIVALAPAPRRPEARRSALRPIRIVHSPALFDRHPQRPSAPPVQAALGWPWHTPDAAATTRVDIARPLSLSIASGTAVPARRVSGSFWMLARPGGQTGFAPGGQLGGSQAGVRLWYPLARSVAVTGRLSAPVSQPGREAGIDVALREGGYGIIVEKRIALDRGGRNDVGALVFGGIDAVPLPLAMRLDGYGQAGVVGRDMFADGAIRVERTLHERDSLRVSAGAGAWGAAQPGAARIDIGPQLVATLPVADQRVRLSAEWRFRIAGDARPGSGPALTIGTDF